MLAIMEGLDEDAWSGFLVPHKYMGPLPSCFYPVAQLVDYAVHSWDIRQGTGRATRWTATRPTCSSRSASSSGSRPPIAPASSLHVGIRVSGRSGGDTRVSVTPEGVTLEPGDLDDLPVVLEFDPASFVLTAMGRINAGTARGDSRLAERYTNLFFRI